MQRLKSCYTSSTACFYYFNLLNELVGKKKNHLTATDFEFSAVLITKNGQLKIVCKRLSNAVDKRFPDLPQFSYTRGGVVRYLYAEYFALGFFVLSRST